MSNVISVATDTNGFNVKNLTVGEKMQLVADLNSCKPQDEIAVAKNHGVVV